jgi:ATP-dependent DNA helicase RecQ
LPNFIPLLQSLLQQYWNYPSFRPQQEEIINTVLEGKDTFVVLPTGGGKSVCYQLPAIARDGFCLVVSPLIALMQDQVAQLKQRGIPAAMVHSGMKKQQVNHVWDEAARGVYKLLYVSPERLQTEAFLAYAKEFDLNLIAVDEAHCISQWGHDFRPAYRKINSLRSLFPRVPVLALTASANTQVKEDIIQQLNLRAPAVFTQSVVRSNLFYHIRYTENKPVDTARLFSSVKGSGILYCRSRKRCEETAILLRNDGVDASVYHAGMFREERDQARQRWTESNKQVVCATSAFGMGIDKPDVRVVAHYDAPLSIEEYYQEAGRAGRDGGKAHAILLYNHKDILRLEESTDISYPAEEYIRKIYHLVGDFLQMPVGKGNDEFQPFDALLFIRNFKLDVLKTLSAIRLLEREGFWQWNEQANMQTQLRFTTDRETLQYLEQNEPRLSYIATGLLRLYGSVYNFYTPIREFEVSKLLRMEKPALDEGLCRLSALGVIDFQPAVSGGSLYWMHNRLSQEHLVLDAKHIDHLRSVHRERVKKMIVYIREEKTCRNILLSDYFGEQITEPCGNCDACKRNARERVSDKEDVKSRILDLIRRQQQISVPEILQGFPDVESSRIIEYIRLLNDEKLCRVYPEGMVWAIQPE